MQIALLSVCMCAEWLYLTIFYFFLVKFFLACWHTWNNYRNPQNHLILWNILSVLFDTLKIELGLLYFKERERESSHHSGTWDAGDRAQSFMPTDQILYLLYHLQYHLLPFFKPLIKVSGICVKWSVIEVVISNRS